MTSEDPHRLEAGHLPTPFSADEIRAATPQGRTQVVRTEPLGGAASTRRVRYVEPDAEGVIQVRTSIGEDGEDQDAPVRERVTWRDLQSHASYPADRTSLERARLEHPLGDLDCVRYTMGDGDAVDTVWFDLARPGLPVLLESRRGSDLVLRVTLLSDEVDPG
ncbi:hypothetical protein [Phycicoccus flavus]|uniref:hypothetical protein n=1 Tax=Phycicoccus flavus TaxID=2502783 RepID=UPI000FEB7DCD|nr:hypothetical protein [Phycicoccus flavus]NHA67145.1 hypothetical protein [Phycicoccus flavus]